MVSRVRGMPPIKLDEYRWRSTPNDPTLRVRRACATEAMFGIEASNRRGENDFFIAVTIHFQASSVASRVLTLRDLERMTQSSLVQLRASQPQVAVNLSWDRQGKCMLQYRAPVDLNEACQWAASIVTAEASPCRLMDMRDHVEEKKRASGITARNDAITIYISAPVSGLHSTLENSKLHYLFRFNHCLFDGIAAREIVRMFFQNLVSDIYSDTLTTNRDIHWEQTISNLPPAFVELMDSEQDLSGSKFDRTVHDHMTLMKKKVAFHQCLLEYIEIFHIKRLSPARPQTEFYTFAETDSQSILSGIRTRLQPGHSITHLATGAVLLALTKGDIARNATIFSSISVIDGRRYLKEGYKQGEKLYIASCQTPAILVFENIDKLSISDISSKDEVRQKLKKATELAKECFASNLATPCKLSMSVPVMEFGAVLAAMYVSFGISQK
ncbi:15-o-acetyltransferase [Trichoderma arundinaceum]|uniref:15-o-acetyltransferase n=1 Tax=Trichoderma arundinaceum TaxID=490622 RepID=A0A395NBT7_TRIAR|nr:15-o-acetyltransferase [Trichoderma arundinaceum]